MKQFYLTFFLLCLNIYYAYSSQPYFQQHIKYNIYVELDDVNHFLNGTISFEYQNNSPDTLTEIKIHLWPNAYKTKNSPLAKQLLINGNASLYFANENERGFIDKLDFRQNDNAVIYKEEEIDFGSLKLNTPLLPGASTTISTPFRVKIPDARFSRMGHDKQAYYLTQWYPKPAVYDKNGWHAMSNLDQGEFYADFAEYDVDIMLPQNYVVCATGVCKNESEKNRIDSIAFATSLLNEFSADNSFPSSSPTEKTIHYHQSDVHDFAWFADKRYHVLKSEVTLPHSGRKVQSFVYFTNASPVLWKKGTQHINEALYYYSLWNGDYIYSQCSAAEGTGGVVGAMEYPMVTLIASVADSFELEGDIVHEVGHNWFQGMIATNERDFAWMDEGVNSFYENRFYYTRYPYSDKWNNNDLTLNAGKTVSKLFGLQHLTPTEALQYEFNLNAKNYSDQPLNITSAEYTKSNYGNIVYFKAALALNYLKAYLGDSLFDKTMQLYFTEWNLKHPYLEDLFAILNKQTGKDLAWLNDLFTSTKKIDYAITSLDKTADIYYIRVKNEGEIASPVFITGLINDSAVYELTIDGFNESKDVSVNCSRCNEFILDYHHYSLDINRNNDNIKTTALFRKSDPLYLSILPKVEAGNAHSLYILPSVGWNEYNKWMPGLTIYNRSVPLKHFEYSFAALYGTADEQLAGIGSADYHFFSQKGFADLISPGVTVKHFAYERASTRTGYNNFNDQWLHYSRIEPHLDLTLRKKSPTSTISRKIVISALSVSEENIYLKQRFPSEGYNVTAVKDVKRNTFRIHYNYSENRILDPFNYNFLIEGTDKYQKLYGELNMHFVYPSVKKGVSLRFFGGYQTAGNNEGYPFYLNSWQGPQDSWYDEVYFGRSEYNGLASQQMSLHDGGFKSLIPYASSDKWMAACNLDIGLPGIIPVSIFFDGGTFDNAKDILLIYDQKQGFIYDGGACVHIYNLKVYFPFIRSKDLQNYTKGTFGNKELSFGKQIRFELDLNAVNPFYIRNRLME
jgi:hypothetical protein